MMQYRLTRKRVGWREMTEEMYVPISWINCTVTSQLTIFLNTSGIYMSDFEYLKKCGTEYVPGT